MGSGLSRHSSYPFPVPLTGTGDGPLYSKPAMWSLSKKKNKKVKEYEKPDDYIVAKYPNPTAFPMPYYPQMSMQSTFPAYYAPVQMAFVQPFAVQQPVLAMPQSFLPMAYPTTAAPVQPAVVAATAAQPAPAMQMPIPPPGPAPAPISAPVIPQPPPPPPPVAQMPEPQRRRQSQPPVAPTQMPGPHPPPPAHAHVLPPSPVAAEPVIPPPPFGGSDRDTGRIRFTDFYRSAANAPDYPPTSGAPGRTPYSGPLQMPEPPTTSAQMPMPPPSSTPAPMPMQMPTPGAGQGPSTIPRSNNPLPPPPQDVWDTSPYRHVLANLPTELPDFLDMQHRVDVPIDEPESMSRPPSRLGSLFGRDKGKKPMKGLFRSRSTAGPGDIGAGPSRHSRSHTMTTFVIPPSVASSAGAGPSAPVVPGQPIDMPVPNAGPPIRFDHTGELSGFVNHSPHRVMFKNKLYPTALHLLEALKFTHQPALQERIRTCKDVHDMYPLSASLQEHVRPDWGQVFLKVMEDVLYLKFKQHPTLRKLLIRTGVADIIYTDENAYWGDGPSGQGANELGKALVRLRERLRQEPDN